MQLHANIQSRLDTGLQDEPISAGNAFRVEQCVNDKLLRLGRWPFDPEFDETRKFLAGSKPGIDCQSARRRTITLTFADRAKITCAQEDDRFILVLRSIER
jgi:hypothetical protein